ncbi:MAG TPA: DUF3750 domain-containing protein [Xanthobacteraceae bacterium]|nr:DUF3750 domain-containing protein [Xanthobacteraceae bacterium]
MRLRTVLLAVLAIFLLPLAVHAALYLSEDRPRRWSQANWGSTGLLQPAQKVEEARLIVFTARTGAWKGIFAVHSWIVVKPAGAAQWTRYDVVGWGSPVRVNGWAPDARWFGDNPKVLVEARGDEATALIPKVQKAIADYAYANAGDYRVWPGPNSNTFVATVLRAVPELDATLPPTALGKDFHERATAGRTPSGTGFEASLFGLLGVTVAWAEGIEFNFLGLVAGLDLRYPALKLPGFGRIGFALPATATAAD